LLDILPQGISVRDDKRDGVKIRIVAAPAASAAVADPASHSDNVFEAT
jgi:hypothetical protein